MGLRDVALAGVARQLSHPSGPVGRVVGRALNRGNRAVLEAAVDASQAAPDLVAADVGFGGGLSLAMLLRRTADGGVVHGIESSTTMLAQARRRFARDVTAGRLELHQASMTQLPLPDKCVDAVISTNTVYFVDDLPAAAAELARITKPGGRVVLGVGDPEAMADMPVTRHGFRLRPVREIVDSLGAAGVVLVEDVRVGSDARPFHVIVGVVDAEPR